jgi:hypothetical protein
MNSGAPTDADDLEDDAPARSPTRRGGRIIAMPAEPIPAEVNDAFLKDLASSERLARPAGSPSASACPQSRPVAAFRRSGGAVRRHLGRPGLTGPQQSTIDRKANA